MHLRKNFFRARVAKHWNGLPREVAESPSLEVLKSHAAGALRDTVRPWDSAGQVDGCA